MPKVTSSITKQNEDYSPGLLVLQRMWGNAQGRSCMLVMQMLVGKVMVLMMVVATMVLVVLVTVE